MPVSANHPYEALIWEYALNKLGNPKGAAAMMGNWWAESSLYPNRLQGTKVGDGKSEAYTAKVDSGEINRHDFIYNGPGGGGYGLTQWTYKTRKANMYDHWKKGNYGSIGDIYLALDFWWWELNNGYSGSRKALINATNIKEASNYILFHYESPADQGTSAQSKRATRAQKYYDYYADGNYEPPTDPETPSTSTNPGYQYCNVTEGEYVNIRSGPSTSNEVAGILHRGDTVYVESITNGWAKISYPVSGYVMASFLQTESLGGDDTTAVNKYMYATVPDGEWLNIRSEANTSSSVVDIIHRGDAVFVVSISNGWAKISSPVQGYVMLSWLQYDPINQEGGSAGPGEGYFPPPSSDFIRRYLLMYKGRGIRVVR